MTLSFDVILSSFLQPHLPNDLFSSGFQQQFAIHATSLAHLILIDFIAVKIHDEDWAAFKCYHIIILLEFDWS
jgi:hypothetical protein